MGNIQQFVKHVRAECKAHGIKFVLKRSTYILTPDKIRCVGYFDADDRKELVVAGKDRNWLMTLVHEYGHLTQWVENCKEWRETEDIDNIDDWLNGIEVPNAKKALAKTRDLELDNEKRSVQLIKAWGLPINTKIYTQKANAYIQYYNYLYYTRRWHHPDNSPSKNPKVYKQMPSTFSMDYKKLSDKYKKVFEDAGF